MSGDSRTFRLPEGLTFVKVGEATEQFLRRKNMIVEGTSSAEGYFIQAKENADGWKKIAGMDIALQVQITPANDMCIVNCGNGKWSDKLGAGAVGVLLFAPLAITAGFGAYKQSKLPAEVLNYIESFIAGGGRSVVVAGSGLVAPGKKIEAGQTQCPNCKEINPIGVKFCNQCGGKLTITCPKCNADLPIGVKFCTGCGADVNAEIQTADTEKCPKCGAEVQTGVKFCNECGENLEIARENADKIACPKCGTLMAKDVKFCDECGSKMSGGAVCSNCNAEIPEGKKFCSECGTPVEK
jgi:rRNA maturation endonuclease Nob1